MASSAGKLAAGAAALARSRPRRLHPFEEGEVGGLGRVGMALELALLVVVRDGLLQLRERLIAAHGALRQFLPALAEGLRLGARRVEVAVGPDLGEQRRPGLLDG